MDEAKIRDLVKGWYYKRAKPETDPVSKFVFLWFCFNAVLAFESGEDSDRDMLEWLKSSAASGSRLRRAYDMAMRSSGFRENLEGLAQLCPIVSVRYPNKKAVIQSPEDFPNIVEAIYLVRCNLFHGSKGSSDVRDQKLIKRCALILEKWVGNILSLW
jgi:hypothetical protein